MLDLISKEQDEIWSSADQDDLQRTTDLARRALGVSTAVLRSLATDGDKVRHLSGDPSAAQEAEPGLSEASAVPSARLDAPLIVAGWPALGVLSVVATEPRHWTETDRATLRDLADSLAELLVARCRAAERDADGISQEVLTRPALKPSLQAIVELTGRLETDANPASVAAHASAIRAIAEALLAPEALQASEASEAAPTVAEAAVSPASDEPADGTAIGARILLADDLDLNRKLISDMLAIEGHVVDSVADGAAAVKAAGEGAYDLILMDMIMPGMDGVAAARAIRALPAPAGDVPIVALTAHSLNEQLDNCLQAGMNDLLTKPMSLDALTSAVTTWMRPNRKTA